MGKLISEKKKCLSKLKHILLPNNLYSNRVGPQVLTTLITVLPIHLYNTVLQAMT